MTAFWTAGGAPIAPDSPMPFTPNGLRRGGICIGNRWKLGRSAALGGV
jgi:hypothetical protein